MKNNCSRTTLSAIASLALLLGACGGAEPASEFPPAQTGVAVDVQPTAADVAPLAGATFQASVTGTVNTSVTWKVTEAGGGSVDASGRYVAPSGTGTFHIVATSVADPSVSSSAVVTVTSTPSVTVGVSPGTATVGYSQSVTFTATVAGSSDTAVTWTVQETSGCGAVSSAGVYTAPTSAATCHVVATSHADPSKKATATVYVTAPPPAGSSWMTTANRTSGVAPLAVFFDAVDTVPGTKWTRTWSSGVFQPADIIGSHYEWDFGDPGSGTWSQTGKSRNGAIGFTAAHVYEAPGTYTATLTVTDQTGTVRTYAQAITVAAISGTTYYVAANGSDSNNGTSTSTPFLTASKGFSMAKANASILFRRGDTFAAGPLSISAAGPGIVGTYGTGARPVIVSSANNTSQNGANAITINNDWRVMDLEIRGTAWAALQSGGTYPLFLRNFVNGGSGVFCGLGGGGTGAAFVENEVSAPSTYGTYFEGYQFAVLGNNVHNIGTSHAIRIPHMAKGVVSQNRMWDPGTTRQALKLHSDNGSNDTRWVTVTDNLWRSDLWTISIGAQDAGVYETPSHILVERNTGYAVSGTTASLIMHSSNMIARNNVFDMTGSSTNGCLAIWSVHMGTVVPVEDDQRIYNNTIYRGGAAQDFAGVGITAWPTNTTASAPTNVRVRNNLVMAATQAGKYVVAVDTSAVIAGGSPPGATLVNQNNLLVADAFFANAGAGDFSLRAGSPAVDAGATLVDVPTDYLGIRRQLGSGFDLGAFESR